MPTKQFRSALVLLVVLITAACARGAAANPDVICADSAGVKIITSGPRDPALAWTFEEIDVIRDSVGEPYLFNYVLPFQDLADRAGRTYVPTRDPSIVPPWSTCSGLMAFTPARCAGAGCRSRYFPAISCSSPARTRTAAGRSSLA